MIKFLFTHLEILNLIEALEYQEISHFQARFEKNKKNLLLKLESAKLILEQQQEESQNEQN